MGLDGFSLYSVSGPILLVLFVLSLISVSVIVAKILDLRGAASGTEARNAAIDAWRKGDRQAAARTLAGGRAPADRVVRATMDRIDTASDSAGAEAHALRLGNSEVATMHRHIRLLEVIAIVSPLLGLLGTVLGMIESFQQLQLAGGSANASVLAGGIWQALLTTAAGLVVAIPSTLAANLLSARVDRASHLIEDGIARLLDSQGADPAT